MRRRPACQTLSKYFNILSVLASEGADLLKALALLSNIPVRRYEIAQEDSKLYWKSAKRPHFSR